MKNRMVIGACVLAAMAFGAGTLVTVAVQPEKKPGKPEMPAMPPEFEAMMALGTPGPEHDLLKKFVGAWDGTVEMFGPMAGPPSKGVMTNSLVLGGRFLRHEWKGDFMGQPFEGLGYWGFDRVKKKWIGTWADTMITGMMTSEGDHDAGKKTWSHTSSMTGPGGEAMKSRDVITWISDDSHTMEMFRDIDGKDTLEMRITYKRKK